MGRKRPERPRAKRTSSKGAEEERERPVREDLVHAAALEAYGMVRHEGRLADRALDGTLRGRRQLWSAERRVVAERVYALLRRQRTVDWLLEQAAPQMGGLTSTEQDLLRLCASRVLHGEDPGMVAGAARLNSRDAAALQRLPEAATRLLSLPLQERFALQASLPGFLAEKLLAQLGPEAERAMVAMNERAQLCARANTLKTSVERLHFLLREEGVDCQPTPLSPLGLLLRTRTNAYSLRAFREGLFELQDEGSQLLGMLVDAPPTKVVDACAGAGGKTLQLAAQMKNRGELFAFDVDAPRLDELRRRARRAGVHNTRVRAIPASGAEALQALADLEDKADRVLVDAPCSGTGTYRRKPDARYRLGPDDLVVHVHRQRELLSRFSRLVKPGGRLVYGTCSLLREENEEVVEDFLSRHPGFRQADAAAYLPGDVGPKVTHNGYLRLYPHLHGTDGFFGAVLVRAR